jgi:hypothetical protein
MVLAIPHSRNLTIKVPVRAILCIFVITGPCAYFKIVGPKRGLGEGTPIANFPKYGLVGSAGPCRGFVGALSGHCRGIVRGIVRASAEHCRSVVGALSEHFGERPPFRGFGVWAPPQPPNPAALLTATLGSQGCRKEGPPIPAAGLTACLGTQNCRRARAPVEAF